MRTILLALVAIATPAVGLAQRPDIPPQRIEARELGYAPVEQAEAFDLPAGMMFDQVAAMDIDARGHLYVLHRGSEPLLEFDADGRLIRAFGEGLFVRAHGLNIDREGNFWVTDVAANVVMKLDSDANVLMTLGTAGQAGEWNEASGSRFFDQPTDIAVGSDGDIFVTQGHNRGEPGVLKFDKTGAFLKSWGGRGTAPGEFAVAHAIVIDSSDLLYVADRENRRIQVFDSDGEFIKGWLYKGMACALFLFDDQSLYMTTGFDGQIVELDMNGNVLGVAGRPGEGLGEFGEAHDIVVASTEEIFVADVVNRRVQKYVKR